MEISDIAAYMIASQSALARRGTAIGMARQNLEAIESLAKMTGEAGAIASSLGRGQAIDILV